MPVITVEAEKTIARPIEVVRAQFADLQHHEDARVHPDLSFTSLRQEGSICRFTSKRRLLGMTQIDHGQLEIRADGSVEIRILEGSNAGLRIHQRFEAEGPDRTRVLARVDMPVEGLKRLLAPILRAGLRRDTENGLEQDRQDLEEKGYGVGEARATA